MGVEVARSGAAGEYGSYNLTDRLHDDHLHSYEIRRPYRRSGSLSSSRVVFAANRLHNRFAKY
ncbi:hypothetical protein J7J63_08945, partial [Candidatus Bipolaricaulota bacterium]|nr:hypothetical protein [Candidatus Bipolaricaulota bacterium]